MTTRLRLALGAVVGIAVAVALSRVNLADVRHSLEAMSWDWAAAAAVVNLAGLAIDAARWRIIVSAVTPVSFLDMCHAALVGVASNVVFPFKLGEGARAYVLATRTRLLGATALTTVIVDRLIDAVTLPLFITLAGLVLPLPSSVTWYRPYAIPAVMVAIAGAALGRRWIRRRRARTATEAEGPSATIDRIADGLRVLDHRHRLASTVVVALCSWVMRAAIVWCMFQAFGLDLPVSAAVGTLAMINVGIALVATPGNLGTFELVTAGALALWGVAPAEGLSLGVAMHAIEVVPPATLGAAGLFFSRDRLAC